MRRRAFVALLLGGLAAACTASPPTGESGVQGRVTVGPMCPVVQVGVPCPDAPLEADLEVLNSQGRVVARAHSGADGVYRVPLSAGAYTIVPLSPGAGGLPSASPSPVRIEPGQWLTLDIQYDSGIR